ncbi:MAG: NAD(P)/FAD-dependent oxidoreductase [Nitrosomonadaceae bacterium]|jgi:sulfide dehydrogenase [flavocytochrome c] flavoprotein subunit|nr:NAD(P)/FAD-dependent oxidoreductase [Nitrosomonadaceae bacterium]
MTINRRGFIKAGAATAGAGAIASISGCASVGGASGPKVVIVGGGYGGATAAKYIKMWAPNFDVTVVERNTSFVSCPISNLVLGGSQKIEDVTMSYDTLQNKWGVRLVRGEATAIDVEKKQVRLASGDVLPFDRVVLSPGIDFMYELVPGLNNADAQARYLHAWKAGPQTVGLRRQLEAMKDGGVYALSIPEAPYRCPPGPYERACQVASYFKQFKPKSKVLILDANMDVVSKPGLFKKAWADMYGGIVEYRGQSKVTDVDTRTSTAKLEFGDVKADVLNVLPPMKAGKIADPFITANRRWCEINWITYEAKNVPGVHLLGDALQIAPLMPKSAHMANNHGKTCAAAVVALLSGEAPNPSPTLNNTCYSFVSADRVVHVASIHKYDEKDKTMKTVPGSGGVSSAANELEAQYAMAWAKNIWADTLA